MEAYDTLTKIKEQIFSGDLSKAEIASLHRRIKARTADCEDLAELWQMRARLATLAGDTADAEVVKRRGSDFFVSSSTIEAAKAATSSFNPNAPIRKRWALLAGTGTFRYKDELGVADFEYARQDLMLLEKTLAGKFSFPAINTLYRERFTLNEWRQAVAQLREQVQEEDLVVIYVLSHGKPTKEDRNSTSFIYAYDSRGGDPQKTYASSIQVIDLVQELYRELRAQRIILILDACFSGDAISGQRDYAGHPAPHLLEAFTRGSGRAVIAAAKANQKSWELPAKKQGAFMYCFGQASQTASTVGEIFAATKGCVAKEVGALGPGHDQEPELFSSDGAKSIALAAR